MYKMEKTARIKNKQSHRAILKGFYLVLIVMLMSITVISAADWTTSDNYKSFEESVGDYGKIIIYDKDFFSSDDKIQEVQLKTNTEQCYLNNCKATKTIIMHESGVLINDVRFLSGSKEVNINSYQFYIVDEEKRTPYELGTDVKVGTYEIDFEGKLKPFQSVDWQILIGNDYWTTEWADWTSGLNTNLMAYYDFNIGSGDRLPNVQDSLRYNGTLTNSPVWNATGIIGGGLEFDGTQNVSIQPKFPLEDNFTISFWIRGESTAKRLFSTPGLVWVTQNTNTISFNVVADTDKTVTTDAGTTFTNGKWHNVIVMYNGTQQTIFVDGQINKTEDNTGVVANAGDPGASTLGSSEDGAVPYIGGMDEVAIWNRSITTAEVTQLWNSGAGISQTDITTTVLISPINNTLSGNVPMNFTASVTPSSNTNSTNATIQIYDSDGDLFNETTKIITGDTINTTTFNIYGLTPGTYTWNVLGCAVNLTATNCQYAANNFTLSYGITIINETYNSKTTSGALNTFSINLTTDGSIVTIGYLNYNGTNILGSISSSGDTYTLSKNQIAPGVSTATNISFYWNITLDGGASFASTTHNQTVNPIVINETCVNMYVIYNFTSVDEKTQAKLNGSTQNTTIKVDLDLYTSDRTLKLLDFSKSFLEKNPVAICIDDNLSNGATYSVDTQVEYMADGYSTEFYNLEKEVLSSSTLHRNITLYDLDTTNSQSFRLLIRDTSYLPIDGALVKIERKYLENGTFYVTEIPKADEGGITSASLEVNDVIYNFHVYDAGTLVSSFTNVLAICQTPLVSQCEIDFNAFQSTIEIPSYEEGDDFNFTLGYDDATRIVSSQFIIPSAEPSTIKLTVIREDTLGTAVCSDTLVSSSGTLSCLVPSAFGNATVIAKLYKDDVEQGKGNIKLDQSSSDIFGPILILLSVLVMMTLIGVGVSDNPVVTGAFIFVGVILLFGMNLVQNTGFIGAGATILFLAIAIILVIIKAARRS